MFVLAFLLGGLSWPNCPQTDVASIAVLQIRNGITGRRVRGFRTVALLITMNYGKAKLYTRMLGLCRASTLRTSSIAAKTSNAPSTPQEYLT